MKPARPSGRRRSLGVSKRQSPRPKRSSPAPPAGVIPSVVAPALFGEGITATAAAPRPDASTVTGGLVLPPLSPAAPQSGAAVLNVTFPPPPGTSQRISTRRPVTGSPRPRRQSKAPAVVSLSPPVPVAASPLATVAAAAAASPRGKAVLTFVNFAGSSPLLGAAGAPGRSPGLMQSPLSPSGAIAFSASTPPQQVTPADSPASPGSSPPLGTAGTSDGSPGLVQSPLSSASAAPASALPQPAPASRGSPASHGPLIPSPPPSRVAKGSPRRPSIGSGKGAAKAKGAAAAAPAPAPSGAAASALPFKLTCLADLVDVVMGRAPEGRRTMPNLISASIKPIVQLPDLVCNTRQTPGVTRAGALFIAAGPVLYAFAADGAELPVVAMPDLGLSEKAFVAVCDPLRKTVLIADANGAESRLVAMRRDTRSVSWSTARGAMHFCHGLALLPEQSLVLASSYYGNCIQAYQTSDGSKAGEAALFQPTFLAADPVSALVFAATYKEGEGGTVAAFQWRGISGLTTFRATVEAAGSTAARRPLALMPAPRGGPGQSVLVVGTQKSPELRVLALPSLELIHTHVLEGVQVQGLGADSARHYAQAGDGDDGGTPSLIVFDIASGDVLILPWPLEGMPLLD